MKDAQHWFVRYIQLWFRAFLHRGFSSNLRRKSGEFSWIWSLQAFNCKIKSVKVNGEHGRCQQKRAKSAKHIGFKGERYEKFPSTNCSKACESSKTPVVAQNREISCGAHGVIKKAKIVRWSSWYWNKPCKRTGGLPHWDLVCLSVNVYQ